MPALTSLCAFTARDGENIALLEWFRAEDERSEPSKGTVIVVHGLGEHARRYTHVAKMLLDAGWNVRSYDQYGHGDSSGRRGDLPEYMRLVHDLGDVVDATLREHTASQKLILLGHSMGGLVAASLVSHDMRGIDGLILSSPAFDPGLNGFQKFLLETLYEFAPHWRVGNGLKLKHLCRDPEVIRAYRNDPLVHRKISATLAKFIAEEGMACLEAAPTWQLPTLLLYAGDDKLVNPAGSRAFAQAAPASFVQTHCMQHMAHEILNDPEKEQVFDLMRQWLAQF